MGIVFKGARGFLAGIGVALAAPIVSPVLGAVGRPVAKAAIKSYLSAVDCVKSAAAEVKREWDGLVAEAKAERAAAAAHPPAPCPSRAAPL